MLLNLAADKPFVFNERDFVFFDRKSLEKQLPSFFSNRVVSDIYVVNWPGYFSSTRIWVEVVNILKFLRYFKQIFFLSKLDLFRQYMKQSNINEVYLFSGNKNKFILLKENSYREIFKKDLQSDIVVEELFELELSNKKILYSELLKDYKNYKWNYLVDKSYLYPFYIFAPIVDTKKAC